MLIERLNPDPGKTEITFPGGVVYTFLPRTDGKQVAEVADPDHAERMLSIPEGFRRADGDAAPQLVKLTGDQIVIAPAAAPAAPAIKPPQTPEEAIALMTALQAEEPDYAAEVAWPDLFPRDDDADPDLDPTDTTEPADPTEGTDTDTPPGDATTAQGWDAVGDAELRDMFEKEVGRKPHHKAGRDTLIAQIETARAGA